MIYYTIIKFLLEKYKMPIQKCYINGKSGFKYGSTGKCYRSKSKALRQMRAIKASQNRKRNN